MPRKARFYLPNIPVHVVQRGNCRQVVFKKLDVLNYQCKGCDNAILTMSDSDLASSFFIIFAR